MNWKILTAFTAGALIASGIVYLAVKDSPVPAAPAFSEELPRPVPPPAAPAGAAASASMASSPVHIRQKPSPMVRREKPVAVAHLQSPPVRLEAPQPVSRTAPKAPVETQIPSEPVQAAPAPGAAQPVAPPEEVQPPEREPEVRVPHTVTITAGTLLQVRIGETISAAHYEVGDVFLATLDRPLVVDGFIIAERGSRLEGRVVEAQPAGRANATSRLAIELVKLSTSDGQRILIRTQPYKKDEAIVGAGAAVVAGAALSRGKPAEIPVESRISFRIENPITITERLN